LDDMYIPCGAVRRVSALQAQIGRSLPRDFGRGAWEATYSFNTYGANSGSPVFNISGNQVVAIHGAEGKSSRLPNVGITVEKLRALIERAQMVVN
ncbi:MAG TPA: hypothetical protein VI457_02345, partial [Methylococcaceae bacterium]|nr:hypothetical protein [Methylococcaceae bacterium]